MLDGNLEHAKEKLRHLIINKALKWGEGLLNNGKKARWIFDLREVILTSEGLSLAAESIYDKIKHLDFDMIGGPSIAAEPLVAALVLHCYKNGRNVEGFIVRKEPNNFGLRKKIEGPIKNSKKVILIDDAVNSGSKLLDSITALNSQGCKIINIITLLDFCKSGYYKFRGEGYNVDYIFSLKDFGLETKRLYCYNGGYKSVETKIIDKKEDIIIKLNETFKERIIDFYEYNGLILTAYEGGFVCCFDKNDYSVKWKLQIGESISAPILIDEDGISMITVSSGLKRSLLFFVSIEDGKVLNCMRMKGGIYVTPVLYKDSCIIGIGKNLHYINKKSMSVTWTFKASEIIKVRPIIDQPTEIIYIMSRDGSIYALSLNGKLLWKKHIGWYLGQPPLVYGDFILIVSDLNIIFCLNKRNGSLMWFFELKNRAFDFKVILDKVIVGCAQGYVLFLDCVTGKNIDCIKISNENITELKNKQNNIIAKLENGKHHLIQI